MKRYIGIILSIICVFGLSLQVMAEETLYYTFDGTDSLTVVTNTLSAGGSANMNDGALKLDGTYGLKLGDVGNTFSVSAMVKIDSNGGTNTIFFKDMDNEGNIWTGVISNAKKPAFWTHGASHRWETVALGDMSLGEWCHIAYVEDNATGTLYVNGELVGSGNVESGGGTLYLGATYWAADAVSGMVDNVKLYDDALTASGVMEEYERYVDFEGFIKLPGKVIGDITLIDKIASKNVTWTSGNEEIIDATGKVTRTDEDAKVTLTATIDERVIGEFEITVLKKPSEVNDEVILSYVFDKDRDGDIIYDISGNGNHGAAYNFLEITEYGAHFDGVDDYVKMEKGVLCGHEEITITATFKPETAQQNVFLYAFGNTTDTGYIFLNPSQPATNLLRFAATMSDSANEKEIASLPGIRSNEEVNVTVVISEKQVSMYVDGELVMDGDMGMSVNSLGETEQNYIARSLYGEDAYFAGYVKEFTIYSYAMPESRIKELFGKSVEYAKEEAHEEYIKSVSFEEGIIKAEVDALNRSDVKVGAIVLDEKNEITEALIANPGEEITLARDGVVCVFAFNEKDNTPGHIYVKGDGDGFSYEYAPGRVKIISKETLEGGIAIVAGYDISGALTGVACKAVDLTEGVGEQLEGDFGNAVTFEMLYWVSLSDMISID